MTKKEHGDRPIVEEQQKEESKKRRKVLYALGGSVLAVGNSQPEKWAKPLVDAVVLPAHAATTGDETGSAGADTQKDDVTTPDPCTSGNYSISGCSITGNSKTISSPGGTFWQTSDVNITSAQASIFPACSGVGVALQFSGISSMGPYDAVTNSSGVAHFIFGSGLTALSGGVSKTANFKADNDSTCQVSFAVVDASPPSS